MTSSTGRREALSCGGYPQTGRILRPSVLGVTKTFFGPNVIALSGGRYRLMALHGADGENGKVQAAFDLFI